LCCPLSDGFLLAEEKDDFTNPCPALSVFCVEIFSKIGAETFFSLVFLEESVFATFLYALIPKLLRFIKKIIAPFDIK